VPAAMSSHLRRRHACHYSCSHVSVGRLHPLEQDAPDGAPVAAGKLSRGYSNAPCKFQVCYQISADKSSTRLRFAIRKSASEAIEIRELLRYSKLFNALTLQPLSL
jgi:hypothetical protein